MSCLSTVNCWRLASTGIFVCLLFYVSELYKTTTTSSQVAVQLRHRRHTNDSSHNESPVWNSSLKATDIKKQTDSPLLLIPPPRLSQVLLFGTCDDSTTTIVDTQALVYSLRNTGYTRQISSLLPKCQNNSTITDSLELINSLNKLHVMKSSSSSSVSLLQEWLETSSIRKEDYIMLLLLPSDNKALTVFTRRPSVETLVLQAGHLKLETYGYGQDASAYSTSSSYPVANLEEVCDATSIENCKGTLLRVKDWRYFAITPPFVTTKAVLQTIMPTVMQFHDVVNDSTLAYVLAIAFHNVPHAVSGSLQVSNPSSAFENWDFIDDMKLSSVMIPTREKQFISSYPITISSSSTSIRRNQRFLSCDSALIKESINGLTSEVKNAVEQDFENRKSFVKRVLARTLNAAAVQYKTAACPHGFNNHTKLMILGSMEEKEKKIVRFHFVFKTPCNDSSPFYDWSTLNLMYSATRIGQAGRFTRVLVSSSSYNNTCTPSYVQKLEAQTKSVYPQLSYYVIGPSASSFNTTSESNDTSSSQNALKHWLRNANPSPVQYDDMIVIINSDLYFLQKFDDNNYKSTTDLVDYHAIEGSIGNNSTLLIQDDDPVLLLRTNTTNSSIFMQSTLKESMIPNDIYSCDSALLSSVAKTSNTTNSQVIKLMNDGLRYYKSRMCTEGFNTNERIQII